MQHPAIVNRSDGFLYKANRFEQRINSQNESECSAVQVVYV